MTVSTVVTMGCAEHVDLGAGASPLPQLDVAAPRAWT